MKLTTYQKEAILSQVAGLENASLVRPLLTRHIFPWIESKPGGEETFEPLQSRHELKAIALDFFVESVRDERPDLSPEEILSKVSAEDLAGAIYLTARSLEVVGLYLKVEAQASLVAKQESVNLDDELKKLLEENR